MATFIIGFLIGLFAGVFCGMAMLSLVAMNKTEDSESSNK